MEGTIRSLGKNYCKTYFFVRGTDKKEYFARAADIIDEDGEKVRETEAYPFIWVGAKILSFDVLPVKEEGKTDRAVNIRLNDRASVDRRYWEGRTDAIKEFDYWYKKTGITQTPKTVSRYLDQFIGRGETEKLQEVEYAGWVPVKAKVPESGETVLAQVYDIERNEVYQTFAVHQQDLGDAAWYAVSDSRADTEEVQPESRRLAPDAETHSIVQAWMPLISEYRNHSRK